MAAKKTIPTIDKLLAPGGRLSDALTGYEFRQEQADVCHAVDEAFRHGKHCLVEAGTGVGKTLAYLLPAVRAAARGKKTVISTHTINLQTQLIEKDIPLVAALFPEIELKAVLMKGRGNYLCHQDMDAASSDLFHSMDPTFQELNKWARRTETGDIADLPFTFQAWYDVSANPDTCRNRECRYYDRCFYYKMRWNAQDANLIVVNHALFFSDLMLRREESENTILPDYDHVVFDEAHHLEEVATKVFGLEVGSKRVPHLVDRVRRLKDIDVNLDRLDALGQLNTELFAPFQEGRYEFFFHDVLDEAKEGEMTGAATQVCVALEALQKEMLDQTEGKDPPVAERLQGLARMAGRLREEIHTLAFGSDPSYIRWGENGNAGPRAAARGDQSVRTTLHYTPIEIGKLLEEMLWGKTECVVMTSATLSNSGGFSYVRSRLAVPEDAIERVVGSPFDFKSQAMLYVPGHLPEPPKAANPAYIDHVACEIERVVELSEGRAFLLFTSYRMMNEVFERLRPKLPYPVFKQGEMPAGRLLEAFRQSGNGCLFGTQTFWEGVDVQGDALSCVIIDRLPFAVPDSPVTRARTDAISAAGGDWFREFSIPQAQIRLKQGFGRLIRTRTDRGIVCILDTRLMTRPYGAEFVKYLPPASRASLWPRVERFWGGRTEAAGSGQQAATEA